MLWMGWVVLPILGIALHRFATWKWGVAVSHDSIFYMSAAESILRGDGVSWVDAGNVLKPLIHFPPFYPLNLSLLGYFMGVRSAADWCAAIYLGMNVILIIFLVFRATKSTGASLLGGMSALISPLLLGIHLEAMSEPLYLSLTLASIILLAESLKSRSNWRLIGGAACASLAYLTRYIGVATIVAGLSSLLLLYPGTFRARIKKAVLYGAITAVPAFIWHLRNYHLTGSLTNRVLVFHPIYVDKLKEGLLAISEWIFPPSVPLWLSLGLTAILFLITIWIFGIGFVRTRKGRGTQEAFQKVAIPIPLLLYGGVYVVLLLTSLTFFDISTRLDNRILLPLYVILLILIPICIHRMLRPTKLPYRKIAYMLSMALFGVVISAYAYRSLGLIRTIKEEGMGYNNAAWNRSEIITVLRKLDWDVVIYSNEAFPVYYLTGVAAYAIPEKFDPVKAEEREDFQRSMQVMRDRLAQLKSALVVFHQGYLREGMPTLDEMAAGLAIAHESRDGVIFAYPSYLEDWAKFVPSGE